MTLKNITKKILLAMVLIMSIMSTVSAETVGITYLKVGEETYNIDYIAVIKDGNATKECVVRVYYTNRRHADTRLGVGLELISTRTGMFSGKTTYKAKCLESGKIKIEEVSD